MKGFNIDPQQGQAGVKLPVKISVDQFNDDLDKVVKVQAFAGNRLAVLNVIHEGTREVYITADGRDYVAAGGEIYGCLKKK